MGMPGCVGTLWSPQQREGLPEWPVLIASRLSVHQDPIASTCSFMMCLENPAWRKEISAMQFCIVMFNNCFFCLLDLMRQFWELLQKQGFSYVSVRKAVCFTMWFCYKNSRNSQEHPQIMLYAV